jgi:hypothetical protein
MADGGGGVEVSAEVATFEGEVRGDEDLMTAGRTEDRAVVADTKGEGAVADGERASNLLDEA